MSMRCSWSLLHDDFGAAPARDGSGKYGKTSDFGSNGRPNLKSDFKSAISDFPTNHAAIDRFRLASTNVTCTKMESHVL
jgi:hypothetical protein